MNGINLESIQADIGLLIGSNVLQALQPCEIRQSQNGGPFATRTVLRWVLNGPLGRDQTKIPTANFVQANQTLDQQFESYCNLEFNDFKYDAKPTMSQNDRKALGIMEESVTIQNCHYEIVLPWGSYPPNLPSNRTQAEQRLELLKKRLSKNADLLKKYRKFMDDLLKKDHASMVRSEETGLWELIGICRIIPYSIPRNPVKSE